MFERFKILPRLWRTGRLALRLLRDSRVPLGAKVIFGATVVYLLSPLDVVPDWIPVLGQADDLVVLMAGLNLFLKACPRWLVDEHESAIGGSHDRDDEPMAAPRSGGKAGTGSTIEGQYRRMA
jgi:uncharacterized membrane protein YkvA (DUF1232 family)